MGTYMRGSAGTTIGRTVLEGVMHKLPSTRKLYRVSLIVSENGHPFIEYYQARGSANKKKPRKIINFIDLWSADRKHDTNEKNAFSIYIVDKTVTFLAQDETSMNEWLTKIHEYHSRLYPELTQYDAIFEASLLDRGLGKTMSLQGPYRLALCKESLDLVPLLTPAIIEQQQQQQQQQQTNQKSDTNVKQFKLSTALTHHHHHPPQSLVSSQESSSITTTSTNDLEFIHSNNYNQPTTSVSNTPNPLNHSHKPQHLPSEQRFSKRHPLVTQKTIQLARRFIRRCGHTDSNFYIEPGRLSTIGPGDLWFALNKKSTAKHLHELLLATIKTAAAQADDQFLCKAPRSRSGSSSENAHYRAQQSRSSSLVCLNNNNTISNINATDTTSITSNNSNNLSTNNDTNRNTSRIQQHIATASNQLMDAAAAATALANAARNSTTSSLSPGNLISTMPMFSSVNQRATTTTIDQIDEDCGYLPMA